MIKISFTPASHFLISKYSENLKHNISQKPYKKSVGYRTSVIGLHSREDKISMQLLHRFCNNKIHKSTQKHLSARKTLRTYKFYMFLNIIAKHIVTDNVNRHKRVFGNKVRGLCKDSSKNKNLLLSEIKKSQILVEEPELCSSKPQNCTPTCSCYVRSCQSTLSEGHSVQKDDDIDGHRAQEINPVHYKRDAVKFQKVNLGKQMHLRNELVQDHQNQHYDKVSSVGDLLNKDHLVHSGKVPSCPIQRSQRAHRSYNRHSNIYTKSFYLLLTSIVFSLVLPRSLPSVMALGASIICNRIPGLSPKQRIICQSRPDAMVVVGDGDRMALQQCRHQFKDSRWNCSFSGANETFLGVIPHIKTKEVAYYYALRSAAIAHAIATACSQGNISGCGCDRTKPEGSRVLESDKGRNKDPKKRKGREGDNESEDGGRVEEKWGGCSVDVKHGLKFSRLFLDSRETDEDSRALMNLHNNAVGRKMLSSMVKTTCRCTGVSGSCTMRLCWKTLPTLQEIGDRLTTRYNAKRHTKEVESIKGERARKAQFLILKKSKRPNRKPKKSQLVYLHSSPNYCDSSPRAGSLGTRGRFCSRDKNQTGSCDVMCCGRGYTTQLYTTKWQCNCTFHWCCKVTCKECTKQVEVYTCN